MHPIEFLVRLMVWYICILAAGMSYRDGYVLTTIALFVLAVIALNKITKQICQTYADNQAKVKS